MFRITKNTTFQYFFHLWVMSVFISAHILPLPFLLIFEKFIEKKSRQSFWRRSARAVNSMVFKLAGIDIVVPHHLPDPTKRPCVFISNHPTMVDGFIYFSFLGPEIIPLSAPADTLTFPFNIWFPKMGIVDVKRDYFDKVMSTKANTKKRALQKLVDCLTKKNKSVLIFPEGHVEQLKKLHYLHTGAARVAISAHVPLIPLSLINLDLVMIDRLHEKPGRIYVRCHTPLFPPTVSTDVPFRKAVKLFSQKITETMQGMLPTRNIPFDHHDPNPKNIGVFIDIDRTLYQGYSQQDFIKYLMKKSYLSTFTTYTIIWYIILEKLHFISHRTLMERGFGFTKGLNEQTLRMHAEKFFNSHVIPHLVHDMIANIKDHQKSGHTIILVSEVIKPLAEQFKRHFKAQDLACTLISQHNGSYSGKIRRLCTGEEKAQQVEYMAKKHHLNLSKSYCYGDSAADIPMMRLVKHKIAVHPKPELKHEACLHGWNIL